MSIPKNVKIRDGELTDGPCVYYMKDAEGDVLYVGKAAVLSRRVSQYWQRPHGEHIERMVPLIASVDYQTTPSVIEALIFEANEIERLQPHARALKNDGLGLHALGASCDPAGGFTRGPQQHTRFRPPDFAAYSAWSVTLMSFSRESA
jgi:excinuclease UvrABC nuclease subunit